jgi:hypothetical protein
MNPYKKMYALTEEQYRLYKSLVGDEPSADACEPLTAHRSVKPAPSDPSVAHGAVTLAPSDPSVAHGAAPSGPSLAPRALSLAHGAAPSDPSLAHRAAPLAPSDPSLAHGAITLAHGAESFAPRAPSLVPKSKSRAPISSRDAPSDSKIPRIQQQQEAPTSFVCKICGHKFKHKRNLNRHVKIHSVNKYPNWLTL